MIKQHNIYWSNMSTFIEMKRKLGYKFSTQEIILAQIEQLAKKNFESGPGITKEFSEIWGAPRFNESHSYTYTRISILRQFASYLEALGIDTYLPKLPYYKRSGFVPYIYTDKEISNIFKACDEMNVKMIRPDSGLISIPAIFRVLYGTGIRIGEVLALKVEDVYPEQKIIKIKDSKNNKERLIPISDTLAVVCKQFLEYRNLLPFNKVESQYFFVKKNGEKVSYNLIQTRFRMCLEIAGIPFLGRMKGPRIHDFRHTFAVNALAKMSREGMDPYVSLPILSNYLGHSSIESTNHYVRITSAMYPELLAKLDTTSLNIFPRFKAYESDRSI